VPWIVALVALAAGLITWIAGAGFGALWLFAVSAIAVALALPIPYALVSPLYMGIAGWLVDMQPFVILAGWTAVVLRWLWTLYKQRRWPLGGKWIALPAFLVLWTAFGIFVVPSADIKHFMLLFGLQFIASGLLLALVDSARRFEDRLKVVSALILFVLVMTGGVLLQFIGVPIQDVQDTEISDRVEDAYGLDAFPNNLGMIKYGLSSKAGARELRNDVETWIGDNPGVPAAEVFLPRFRTFENHLVIRFEGSARAYSDELAERFDAELIFDNVALSPANTVPRMRSFARNTLTYAGICVIVLPLAIYMAWKGSGRRRLIGRLGVAACLFGAGFSLVRGAWIAILIGIAYLLIDGLISWRRKIEVVIAYLVGALFLTGFFMIRYDVDPLGARALASGSVSTRASVYEDTVASLNGASILFGFGTERARTDTGETHVSNRYIPKAGTHSTYLNYLFRTGVPGAIAIAALYAIAALHARAAARSRTGDERIFIVLLTTAIVAAAAHAVILNYFTEPIYTMSVSIIIGLAMAGAVGLGRSVWPWRTGRAQR
jgi:O-Antigen ligase